MHPACQCQQQLFVLMPALQAMLVSLGRHAGTGHIGPVNLTGCFAFLPAKIKSGDLFTGK